MTLRRAPPTSSQASSVRSSHCVAAVKAGRIDAAVLVRPASGGSTRLDVVVNGLPAYWRGMGTATAAYVAGVTGGAQSWRQILTSMRVDLPWQSAYDTMRAINGELDNTYAPNGAAISIAPR